MYGHAGAAIATLISICNNAASQYAYLGIRVFRHGAPNLSDRDILLATGACALTVLALRGTSVILTACSGIVIYGLVLLARGFFTPAELRLVPLDHFARLMRRAEVKVRG